MVWVESSRPGKRLRSVLSARFRGGGTHHPESPLHALLMFPNFKSDDWYVFVFTATEFSGELIDSPEGRLEWIEDRWMSGPNLWESAHIFFPWIEKGEFFSAKFEYEGDIMRGYDVVFPRF